MKGPPTARDSTHSYQLNLYKMFQDLKEVVQDRFPDVIMNQKYLMNMSPARNCDGAFNVNRIQ